MCLVVGDANMAHIIPGPFLVSVPKWTNVPDNDIGSKFWTVHSVWKLAF